jgi:hypothetical protein
MSRVYPQFDSGFMQREEYMLCDPVAVRGSASVVWACRIHRAADVWYVYISLMLYQADK